MRVAKAVTLTDEERTALLKWSRGRSTPARLVQRARIVLAAADGRRNDEIAADLGCTGPHHVGVWRSRFVANRLEGIQKDTHSRRTSRLVAPRWPPKSSAGQPKRSRPTPRIGPRDPWRRR